MLTHLRIKNFKSWEDTKDVRLAPITVFFGTNSSGKSSLGQLLLILKQTAESADRAQVLITSGREISADIGGFHDFIHHHDLSLPLEFEVGWKRDRPLDIKDILDPGFERSGRSLKFRAEVVASRSQAERMTVTQMEYALGEGGVYPFAASMTNDPGKSRQYDLTFTGFKELRARGRVRQLPRPTRFYGFPEQATAYYQNTNFLPDLSLALEQMLGSLRYLGPLRATADRTYSWPGGAPDDVGPAGEKTIDALLAARARDQQINLRRGGRLRSFQELIAEQLKSLGLIDEFEVKSIGKLRPEHEVRVTVAGGRDQVLLPDVGFGVSQVLPILVQSFYVPVDSTIWIEQPELHLHPRVQKGLADFFVQATQAREPASKKSTPRRTQFLIESHSEHLLRRLQRLVAEKVVPPDEVALYFCEMRNGQSSLRPLDLDLFGNISNWPKDFFGDSMDDIAGQAEAQLEREIDEEEG